MSCPEMVVRGVAHPAPGPTREDPSDLTAAEIATTHLGGRPLYWEHDTAKGPMGTVLASWEGPAGELRVAASVTNPDIQKMVNAGTARGLSLGTDLVCNSEGTVLSKTQQELSVCEQGRRPNTWIDHINNKRVLRRSRASVCTHTHLTLFVRLPSILCEC